MLEALRIPEHKPVTIQLKGPGAVLSFLRKHLFGLLWIERQPMIYHSVTGTQGRNFQRLWPLFPLSESESDGSNRPIKIVK